MKLLHTLKRPGQIIALAIVLLFSSLPSQAAIVGTAEINRTIAGINVNAQTLQKERLWIQQQLVSNGVSKTDSVLRVSQLSDAQVRQVRNKYDEMPAGAGVVGIAVTVGIVLIVTDLLGLTDIFTFIRPIK